MSSHSQQQTKLLKLMHQSLDKRPMPEDVAQHIKQLRRSGGEAACLEDVAGALGRVPSGLRPSSMSRDFHRPADFATQLETAGHFFAAAVPTDPADMDAVQVYLVRIGEEIGKTVGRSDFLHDRLDRNARQSVGLGHLSRRQYNKRFRLAARMELKHERVLREQAKRSLTLASKSRLASAIGFREFARDLPSACFIAYYVARASRRSEFECGSQSRAFDGLCDGLLQLCKRRGRKTNWLAIAHVLPDREVLEQLSDSEKGRLLGSYFARLSEAAELLGDVASQSHLDRRTMIVQRGNDSSTWNLAAGAFNKLREGWFGLLFSLGLDDAVSACCPGKAMRLMAADVAAWHGDGLHPDTKVWADLPTPWSVLAGEAYCTAGLVREVCTRHGVDAQQRGWVCPPTGKRSVAATSITPELVHGVTVSSPRLAHAFRQAGVFSGKTFRPERLGLIDTVQIKYERASHLKFKESEVVS